MRGAARPPFLTPFCVCLILYVGVEGAPRPLDNVVSDYKVAATPRPFLCLHKEKGKEMHSLMRREGLCETRKRVSRGVVLVIAFLRRIALVKGAVRVLLS